MDILAAKESQDVEEIVFNEDGSWATMKPATSNRAAHREGGQSPSLSSCSNGDGACSSNRSPSGMKWNSNMCPGSGNEVIQPCHYYLVIVNMFSVFYMDDG